MPKSIDQADSKLNTSNKKLKQTYSKFDSKNMRVIYMPHWLGFHSIAIYSDVISNKKRCYKSYSKGIMVYVELGSNIGSRLSGNHFYIILDSKDNKGRETVAIVLLSSRGDKNYLKLSESVLNLTATDLKKQIINIGGKVQVLAQKYREIDVKLSTEDEKLLFNLNQKVDELYRVISVYPKHKEKDTYVNIPAVTTIGKRRIDRINGSDPTGTIMILKDDTSEIEK